MNTNVNPLAGYYRKTKKWVSLPSGTSYYKPDVLEFNDSGEVALYAMTANDELTYKNPDALLNGESVRQTLLSCVQGLKNPNKLLVNDVDFLLVAIRNISFGNDMTVTTECPKCNHKDDYTIDTDNVINSAGALDPTYPILLDCGLTVYVIPSTLESELKANKKAFEQSKVTKLLSNTTIDEAEKLKQFSVVFNTMSKFNYEILASSIARIVDEEHELDIPNTKDTESNIKDLLNNLESTDLHKIESAVTTINEIGINKKFVAKCTECEHEWNSPLDFNPTNFFSGS